MSELITRVLGPYGETGKDGRPRIRAVAILANGNRRSKTFTDEQAYGRWFLQAKAESAGQSRPRTISDAIEAFIKFNDDEGFWSALTVARTGKDLRDFGGTSDVPVAELDASMLKAYLRAIAFKPLASQKKRYAAVAGFVAWCHRQGYVATNPCALLGKEHKRWLNPRARREMELGKAQFGSRADAEAYLAGAALLPWAAERVAAMLPLTNGLCSGEIRKLRVRDVDLADGVILVRGKHLKAAARVRAAAIPETMRADLETLTKQRFANELLFATTTGEPHTYKWLLALVKRACTLAELDTLTAHGLRGTFSSLCAIAGFRAIEIASFLGHTGSNNAQTARDHYIRSPERTPALPMARNRDGTVSGRSR